MREAKLTWNLQDAVALCASVEAVCPRAGCHVALTGGALYRDGERKDLDLLFYRIRQVKEIDRKALFSALEMNCGIKVRSGFGWCYKAKCLGRNVDLFFPEEDGGDYPPAEGPQNAASMDEGS